MKSPVIEEEYGKIVFQMPGVPFESHVSKYEAGLKGQWVEVRTYCINNIIFSDIYLS